MELNCSVDQFCVRFIGNFLNKYLHKDSEIMQSKDIHYLYLHTMLNKKIEDFHICHCNL